MENAIKEGIDYGLIEKLFTLAPHILLILFINIVVWIVRVIFIHIPAWGPILLALIMGAVIWPQIADVSKVSYNVKFPEMITYMHGVGLGAIAVAGNQLFRKTVSKYGLPAGDTVVIEKTTVTQTVQPTIPKDTDEH